MRRDVDAAIAAIAERQHGAVTVQQVLGAGGTYRVIARRVAAGTWLRLSPRVMALPGAPRTWRQHVMAAVLEAGDGAVASHRTAAALLRLPGFDEGWPETEKLRGRHHVVTLSTLHETFWLPPEHTTRVDGIPCASLARTVFDLASCVHRGRAERALDNALAHAGLKIGRLIEVVAAVGRSGKPGTALMRELVAARTEGYIPPESDLEALFMAVLDAYGLPQPERQTDLGDGEAWIGRMDFRYVAERVIVEADGRPYHVALLRPGARRSAPCSPGGRGLARDRCEVAPTRR